MLADDALVLSHRLSQWCGNAPDLEVDIALANIALDLLGQARMLLARAAAADPEIVPRLPAGLAGPRRGRARVLQGRGGLPQRPPRRGRQRGLRADRQPGSSCSRPGGWRCWNGCARAGTTGSRRRSPPRGSGNWPTTATSPAAGSSPSPGAPGSRRRRIAAGLAEAWRLSRRAVPNPPSRACARGGGRGRRPRHRRGRGRRGSCAGLRRQRCRPAAR